MKKKLQFQVFYAPILTVVFLMIAVFVYGKIAGGVSISIGSTGSERTFSVDGEGSVDVEPNAYSTTYSIMEQGATQKEAQDEGNTKQTEARKLLTELGFADSDIKTTGYNIYPEYDYTRGQEITGYSINISTTVTSEEIEKINQALDRLVEVGVNVSGVESRVDGDVEEYKKQAREKAIRTAKEKAESLAEAGGFKLGKIASISEGGSTTPIGEPMPLIMKREALDATSAPTQIDPGTNKITSFVTITYYIKD